MNHYHYLNNDDWITNQSTVDNKFYSYDTSALKNYTFANAAITNKIDLTIADNISQEFIKKSSLSSQSSNSLATITTNIINIIYKNINIFKFINSSPLFSIIKNYSLNFIFDDVNTLVGVYYTKWNVGNITKNVNYHYNNNFNNTNSQNWTSSSDKQSILIWTNYAKNWEQFISLYPYFNFNNSKLVLTNMNKNEENTNFIGDTTSISISKTFKYELQNNYNMVIGYER